MHLNKCEINVWDLLPNLKIKIFSCTTKKTHDKFATVRADRDLFERLIIDSSARQIDLKEVLRKFLTELLTEWLPSENYKNVFAKILEFEDQCMLLLAFPHPQH